MGFDAGQCGVEGQLSNRNAHPLDAKIAKAENSLAVRDDNGTHVILGPISQDVVNVALVMYRDEETLIYDTKKQIILFCKLVTIKIGKLSYQGHHILHNILPCLNTTCINEICTEYFEENLNI